MAADGHTSDVTIPALMLERLTGYRIQSFMCSGTKCTGDSNYQQHSVSVTMTFPKQKITKRVGWSFWTSSSDANAVQFKQQFAAAALALGNSSQLTPHYMIRSGKALGCKPWGLFDCGKQCTNKGRYCFEDPDGNMERGLDGSDVVKENLRQLCIFNISSAEGREWKWWQYTDRINSLCLGSIASMERCKTESSLVGNVLAELQIDAKKVLQCIKDSGGYTDNNPNTVLEQQLAAMTDDGVYMLPTVLINGKMYRGNLECPNPNDMSYCGVLNAICASFDAGSLPDVCSKVPQQERFALSKPSQDKSWADAELDCLSNGGHLADIKSLADNVRVLNACLNERCWTGLNDRSTEGRYVWTDGTYLENCYSAEECTKLKTLLHQTEGSSSTVVSKTYAHWAPGEPNNGDAKAGAAGEDCVYMHGKKYADQGKRGMWGDHACEERHAYVCQTPVVWKYMMPKGKAVWSKAQASCVKLGGRLADIRDKKENANLFGMCLSERCWIGLNDADVEGQFGWIGGDKLDPKGYRNWAPGEPNNGGFASDNESDEDCVYVHGARYADLAKFGQWGDHVCAERMNYVCQIPDKEGFQLKAANSTYTTSTASSVTLSVVKPAALRAKFPGNELVISPALFGVPHYGGSITGRLVYGVPGNREACTPLDKTKIKWPAGPVIILLDRGGCKFSQKVRNAQLAGGVACVLVDKTEEDSLPYMGADGVTADIFIPSVLIHKSDGNILKLELCGDKECVKSADYLDSQVNMALTWKIPHGGSTVVWDFFTSSDDKHSSALKKDFAPVAAALGSKAKLKVHYLVGDGRKVGCKPYGPFSCSKQCTNNGRYCATDPDGDLDKGLDGQDIIEENLRQLCIFNVSSAEGHPEKWWTYVSQHEQRCVLGLHQTWEKGCGKTQAVLPQLFKAAGIDGKAVAKCMADSGGLTADGPNSFLEAQIQAQLETGAYLLPTIMVNGQTYRGNLACKDTSNLDHCGLLETLCAGFKPKSAPDICSNGKNVATADAAAAVATASAAATAAGIAQQAVVLSQYIPYQSTQTHLTVTQPILLKAAFPPQGIMLKPALFGVPQFGGSVTARVLYGSKGNRNGCKSFDKTGWPEGMAVILLLERGGCQFGDKLRLAQTAGVASVIVFDNVVTPFLYYMGAYGDNSDIKVPSAFIHKQDGDMLANYMCSGTVGKTLTCPKTADFHKFQVNMQLSWDMPKPNDRVLWSFWTSSVGSGGLANNNSVAFEKRFAPIAEALSYHVDFSASYLVSDGRLMQCLPHFGTKSCDGLCTNGGRYCAPDPDKDPTKGISGVDIVTENLRQSCIFNISTAHKKQQQWWGYVNGFNARCQAGIGGTWERSCRGYQPSAALLRIMSAQGINPAAIMECMDSSGGLTADGPNWVLEESLKAQLDNNVHSLQITPFIINGVKYRGNIECDDPSDLQNCALLSAICAGFYDTTKPAVCGGGTAAYMFKVYAESKPWAEAEGVCKQQGGHLASVRSAPDNRRVLEQCAAQRCWIGLNDLAAEGKPVWADGGPTTQYQRWASGEPNNGGNSADGWGGDEDCMYVHGRGYGDSAQHGRWGDHKCAHSMPFVCQIPVDFRYNRLKLAWPAAQQACLGIGGKLASARSFGDNSKVYSACPHGRCWFGLNDLQAEGRFEWADGTAWLDRKAPGLASTGAADYSNWAPGEPSDTVFNKGTASEIDEDCVYMHGKSYTPVQKRTQWGDHRCDEKMPSICEVQVQHRYEFHAQALGWEEAEQFCLESHGHLANVQSTTENNQVWSLCQTDRCWLGLNDRTTEGTFRWSGDGQALGTIGRLGFKGFTNWAPGEPNNGGHALNAVGDEDCVYIHGGKYEPFTRQMQWGDHQCKEKMAFVCMFPIEKALLQPAPTAAPAPAGSTPSFAPAAPASAPAMTSDTGAMNEASFSQQQAQQAAGVGGGSVNLNLFPVTVRLRLFGISAAQFARPQQRLFMQCFASVLDFDGVKEQDISIVVEARRRIRRRLVGRGGVSLVVEEEVGEADEDEGVGESEGEAWGGGGGGGGGDGGDTGFLESQGALGADGSTSAAAAVVAGRRLSGAFQSGESVKLCITIMAGSLSMARQVKKDVARWTMKEHEVEFSTMLAEQGLPEVRPAGVMIIVGDKRDPASTQRAYPGGGPGGGGADSTPISRVRPTGGASWAQMLLVGVGCAAVLLVAVKQGFIDEATVWDTVAEARAGAKKLHGAAREQIKKAKGRRPSTSQRYGPVSATDDSASHDDLLASPAMAPLGAAMSPGLPPLPPPMGALSPGMAPMTMKTEGMEIHESL
jgi:hypothetical protein